jgi:hypothetical protein
MCKDPHTVGGMTRCQTWILTCNPNILLPCYQPSTEPTYHNLLNKYNFRKISCLKISDYKYQCAKYLWYIRQCFDQSLHLDFIENTCF